MPAAEPTHRSLPAPGKGRPEGADEPALSHLRALCAAVQAGTALRARVAERPGDCGGPVLRVVNPGAGHLAEEIGCRAGGGGHRFTWSWGDDLGPARDVPAAVRAIERVLAADAM
ncbi:hypothetical protein DPM19_23130 [Actinomadura craniellae]|uniref:Uncharacterized protein n=2 Tax=Actinomadura craniellae TaxID=2231787 RepID=A0A365H1D2_9ACTN|nr:hypothetical protein DPM19_23130 [Actinomadura craniellae]